ncbi:hypothetical protein I3842_09G184600 [Carya illinoinensis]|uniref:Uncharacterized protein n=1 Tax=Carya illinoinensis TaxID=32201 RepID=A0A922E600_CARIL|nr:hypothetical protein I3842_09G184600 [Carya illinoinensis]
MHTSIKEDTRQNLVISDDKVLPLETQACLYKWKMLAAMYVTSDSSILLAMLLCGFVRIEKMFYLHILGLFFCVFIIFLWRKVS